jgi:D-alanyl-D-alanine carboxypeptidase
MTLQDGKQLTVKPARKGQHQRLYDAPAGASNSRSRFSDRWWVFLLILLALSCIGAGPPQLVSGHTHPLHLTKGQIDSVMTVRAGPEIDASAAAIVDRDSDALLWSKNAELALPMASTTKLMTALVALESLSPDQVITVPADALIGNASMGLSAGDQVSVRALLYGALLPSGNDAAMTLAIAAAGSEAAFVERMNQRAAEWGLTRTHFVNPHGLDAPDHVSSARDLSTLARHALDNPVIAEVVSTPQITIEGYPLTNTNLLLNAYDGAYGVKTGTTDEAGQVLIAAVDNGHGNALTVVLNSPDRFAETPRMLDFYFDNWRWLDLKLGQNALNKVMAPDGALYTLYSASRPLLLQHWQMDQLRTYRAITFGADSEPAGLYQIWLGEEKLTDVPIQFKRVRPAQNE